MRRGADWHPDAVRRPGKHSGTMQGHGHRVMTLHDPGVRGATLAGVDSHILAVNGEYHAVIDDRHRKIYQYFPFSRGARSAANGGVNRGIGCNKTGARNIQVCVVGRGYGGDNPVKHLSDWGVGVLLEIAAAQRVPLRYRGKKMSEREFIAFSGITGHKHLPANSSSDPGKVPAKFFIRKARKLKKAKRRWRVVATRPKGKVKHVRKRPGGGFSTRVGRSRLTARESRRARAWARRKGFKDWRRTRSRYPFLILDSDTKMPRHVLSKRLNRLGRRRGRYLFINEGWRTHARQWELWRAYQAGHGNLAAYPGTSNHEGGNAADLSVYRWGRAGGRVNVGDDKRSRRLMRRLGLCLPVRGEPWHVERGTTWRA